MTMKEIIELMAWHQNRSIFARDRASRAITHDCQEANKKTADMHDRTVEALSQVQVDV